MSVVDTRSAPEQILNSQLMVDALFGLLPTSLGEVDSSSASSSAVGETLSSSGAAPVDHLVETTMEQEAPWRDHFFGETSDTAHDALPRRLRLIERVVALLGHFVRPESGDDALADNVVDRILDLTSDQIRDAWSFAMGFDSTPTNEIMCEDKPTRENSTDEYQRFLRISQFHGRGGGASFIYWRLLSVGCQNKVVCATRLHRRFLEYCRTADQGGTVVYTSSTEDEDFVPREARPHPQHQMLINFVAWMLISSPELEAFRAALINEGALAPLAARLQTRFLAFPTGAIGFAILRQQYLFAEQLLDRYIVAFNGVVGGARPKFGGGGTSTSSEESEHERTSRRGGVVVGRGGPPPPAAELDFTLRFGRDPSFARVSDVYLLQQVHKLVYLLEERAFFRTRFAMMERGGECGEYGVGGGGSSPLRLYHKMAALLPVSGSAAFGLLETALAADRPAGMALLLGQVKGVGGEGGGGAGGGGKSRRAGDEDLSETLLLGERKRTPWE